MIKATLIKDYSIDIPNGTIPSRTVPKGTVIEFEPTIGGPYELTYREFNQDGKYVNFTFQAEGLDKYAILDFGDGTMSYPEGYTPPALPNKKYLIVGGAVALVLLVLGVWWFGFRKSA